MRLMSEWYGTYEKLCQENVVRKVRLLRQKQPSARCRFCVLHYFSDLFRFSFLHLSTMLPRFSARCRFCVLCRFCDPDHFSCRTHFSDPVLASAPEYVLNKRTASDLYQGAYRRDLLLSVLPLNYLWAFRDIRLTNINLHFPNFLAQAFAQLTKCIS